MIILIVCLPLNTQKEQEEDIFEVLFSKTSLIMCPCFFQSHFFREQLYLIWFRKSLSIWHFIVHKRDEFEKKHFPKSVVDCFSSNLLCIFVCPDSKEKFRQQKQKIAKATILKIIK